MLRVVALNLIKFYQKNLSPYLGHHCRFYPTCSEYTLKSIEKYGFLKGGIKGFKRILRCGPWSRGGIDLP